MRRINAVCIGSAVYDVIRKSVAGEIHSVFDRTFNVMIDGRLVGIARDDVARSPINVITDIHSSESMLSLGVYKGMQVRGGNRVIVDDVLEISLEGAELWRPKTSTKSHIDFDIVGHNLELAKRLAAGKGGSDGLGQLLPLVNEIAAGKIPQASELNMTAKAVLPQLVNLVKTVRSENVEGVKGAAEKLIGLGPGLSPSADDALSGFMAALWWVSHSLNRSIDFVKKINEAIASCSGTTTLLSQHLLRHAAKGETNERVEGLLEVILAGSSLEIGTRVEKVLEIGETSGIDMMVGLLLGLRVGLGRGVVG